jgi:hypothetical protein
MSRQVVVTCEGPCGAEMTLDLKADKAEGGFYACDIEYELRDCGWTVKDGKDLCEECSDPTVEAKP